MSRPRVPIIAVTTVFAVTLACGRQPASPTSPTGRALVAGSEATDGSTLKAEPPTPVSPINDQVAKDFPTLVAKGTAMNYDGNTANIAYHFEVFSDGGAKVLDSGLLDSPTYAIPVRLDYKQRFTWHVRGELQGRVTAWSETVSFLSFEGGYIRDNEVFDPLFDGRTVGEPVGPVSFLGEQGIRLDESFSHVKYLIPTSITSGEFSMEVMGLRPFAPGDKSKVFGMSSGTDDFITDPYRFDVQYRGANGSPPNAITFRALYGSAEDPFLRYEPDTNTRFNSIYLLDPNTVYYWRLTWGKEVRLAVREGGINGRNIYEIAIPAPRGTYDPVPHYAYLGTPPGRSGAESASVPGTIFRNVWIGARSRPQ